MCGMRYNTNVNAPEGWTISCDKKLKKKFSFSSFRDAVNFVCEVAEIAERENHHPDIIISHRNVVVETWTRSKEDVTDKDYLLASSVNALFKGRKT